jgi:hypothetical protein
VASGLGTQRKRYRPRRLLAVVGGADIPDRGLKRMMGVPPTKTLDAPTYSVQLCHHIQDLSSR